MTSALLSPRPSAIPRRCWLWMTPATSRRVSSRWGATPVHRHRRPGRERPGRGLPGVRQRCRARHDRPGVVAASRLNRPPRPMPDRSHPRAGQLAAKPALATRMLGRALDCLLWRQSRLHRRADRGQDPVRAGLKPGKGTWAPAEAAGELAGAAPPGLAAGGRRPAASAMATPRCGGRPMRACSRPAGVPNGGCGWWWPPPTPPACLGTAAGIC
jgi:hypothetical protein